MEYSQKFGFNLPSRDTDDLVDVNLLSDNFTILDYKALSEDDVKQKFDAKSEAPQSGIALAETFANVIKQTKSGAVVFANDVSPIEHNLGVKLSSDIITDFSSVNVTRCGKNIFDADTVLLSLRNPSFTGPNQRWLKQADGSFYLFNTGILHNYDWFVNTEGYTGQMAISITGRSQNGKDGEYVFCLRIYYTDGTNEGVWINYSEEFETKTLISNASKTVLRICQQYSTARDVYIKDIMIAYGNDAEYEPYNPHTITANADGTVELTSISPNMTLFSDTDGMDISVNYNADTKKYIDNKFAELQALILEG